MTGFHVYFNDDAMEEVVHIQAWTLGIGETVSIALLLLTGTVHLTNYTCKFHRLVSVC